MNVFFTEVFRFKFSSSEKTFKACLEDCYVALSLDHTWAAAKTVRGKDLQKMEGGGDLKISAVLFKSRGSQKNKIWNFLNCLFYFTQDITFLPPSAVLLHYLDNH
jgi:hypothetical protein